MILSDVFRTLPNIYDEAFLQRLLIAACCQGKQGKQGPKHAFDYDKILNFNALMSNESMALSLCNARSKKHKIHFTLNESLAHLGYW